MIEVFIQWIPKLIKNNLSVDINSIQLATLNGLLYIFEAQINKVYFFNIYKIKF